MKPQSPESAARRVFGERAASYTTSAAHTDPQVLAQVVALADPQPHWTALDVATGAGHTAFALAPHVARVVGTDLTPEMLAEARELERERRAGNVDFGLADVHYLPFASGAFHLITCRRAAHHFSDILSALAEMGRVLRTGGRVVIDDRSVPEDDWADECMNELDIYHDESHVRQYRPSAWERMLKEAGLAVEQVRPYTKHRPLSSLTGDVSEANVACIHHILNRMTEAQRRIMNLIEQDGELYLNHWYVMISAVKA